MIPTVERELPEAVQELCSRLEDATKQKKSGRCIKFTNKVLDSKHSVDLWKFNEWDYGKPNKIPLPIDARGLFTYGNTHIIVRGYDKFFNVNEVEATKQQNLFKLKGPFDVTMKENGCIIFIGGLPNGQIVVCSKHSTGERADLTRNHAIQGHRQLQEQLQNHGSKSLVELGRFLYEHNLTAVAELCDDEFEEHVLPYSRHDAGLYLHGLNYNTIKFKTVPIELVNDFAQEWGFKTISSLKYNDMTTLFTFLDECAKTGKYEQKEIEGFVVRCKNPDFFFKYKFEQPYLLYRQFREITKKLIIDGIPLENITVKKNKFISREYLKFVQQYFIDHPHFIDVFKDGHGVIELRQAFLLHLNESNGMSLLSVDDALDQELRKLDLNTEVKYVFVPVATIGCGKTTVFQTLANLFPEWVHIQNDDISSSAKVKLAARALQALVDHNVVLLDRNNSSLKERKQIFDSIEKLRGEYLDDIYPIKFICVNFIKDVDETELWNLTTERVFKRGDNHQSIKCSSDPEGAKNVMRSFIQRFQPVNGNKAPDSQFDLIIDLELGNDSSLTNVKLIIDTLAKEFPKLIQEPKPSEQDITNAFNQALAYKPTYTKNMSGEKSVTYFGVSVDRDTVLAQLQQYLSENNSWQVLQERNRVQQEFHITLGHVGSAKGENKAKWKKLLTLFRTKYKSQPKNWLDYYADIKLTEIVIRKNVLICVRAELLGVYNSDFEAIAKVEPLNQYLHITIGTFDASIKPVESNSVLMSIHSESENSEGDDEIVPIEVVVEKQRIFAHY